MGIPIIFGIRRHSDLVGTLGMFCTRCGQQTIHVLTDVRDDPTLFFIAIPLGKPRLHTQCARCKVASRVPKEREAEIRAMAAQ